MAGAELFDQTGRAMSTENNPTIPAVVTIEEGRGDLLINGTLSVLDAQSEDGRRQQAISRLQLLSKLQRSTFAVTMSTDGSTRSLVIDPSGRVTDTTPPAVPAAKEPTAQEQLEACADVCVDTDKTPLKTAAAVKTRLRFTRRRTVIVGVAATVLIAGIAGTLSTRWYGSNRHTAALSSCVSASNELARTVKGLDKAIVDSGAAADIDAKQVVDPATIATLQQARNQGSNPAHGTCSDSMDTAHLNALTATLTTLTGTASTRTVRVRAAADAVVASREAKVLADAKGSLSTAVKAAQGTLDSTHGKVADNKTREALQKALDAANKVLADEGVKDPKRYRDAQASLAAPVKSVNDSVAAKAAADKAAADAAAQAAARAQAQSSSGSSGTKSSSKPRSSNSSSGSTPRRRSTGSAGGSGGTSGNADTGTAPSWSVPGSGSDEGNIGGNDPGL
jgi:hypothetical protein